MEIVMLTRTRIRPVVALILTGIVTAALTPATALGGTKTVIMEVSDPGNTTTKTVKITFENKASGADPLVVSVAIPGGSDARRKRDLIDTALDNAGISSTASGSNKLILSRVDKNTTIKFDNGGTMETDVVSAAGMQAGQSAFEGFFDPFDSNGQPAMFTAGVVTDLGFISASVWADQLNFQTDGPNICNALFNQLAWQMPLIGAEMFLLGDRLEVVFDPQFVQLEGGIQWGTNSPGEGCSGILDLGQPSIELSVDALIGGQVSDLVVTGAVPGDPVYYIYGFDVGHTYIPALDTYAAITSPLLGGTAIADPLGEAVLQVPIPPSASGLDLQLQAAVLGDSSNALSVTIE